MSAPPPIKQEGALMPVTSTQQALPSTPPLLFKTEALSSPPLLPEGSTPPSAAVSLPVKPEADLPSKRERDAACSERRTSKRTRSRKPQPAGEEGKEGKEAKEERKVKKAKEEEGVKREAEGMGDAARRLGEALNAASPKLEAPSKRKGAGEDPFPAFPHPSEAETRLVHAALSQLHPQKAKGKIAPSSCGGRGRVLDSLVSTILSQNTTDTNSHRAYAALTERYASWEEVRTAPKEEVEESIRCGGLAATKTGGLLRPHPLSEVHAHLKMSPCARLGISDDSSLPSNALISSALKT